MVKKYLYVAQLLELSTLFQFVTFFSKASSGEVRCKTKLYVSNTAIIKSE